MPVSSFFQHLRSERGATAVEYGLLVALIAAVIVGTLIVLGTEVLALFESLEWP